MPCPLPCIRSCIELNLIYTGVVVALYDAADAITERTKSWPFTLNDFAR